MLEKWKKAVVHLECATNKEHFTDRDRRNDELIALYERGEIDIDTLTEAVTQNTRSIRFHGTALFIIHEGRRYLLTARHVVWDEHQAKLSTNEGAEWIKGYPENMRQGLLDSAHENAKNTIFGIIFRVPSIDELLANQHDQEKLFCLGAGPYFSAPYTFSEPSIDLAIISLDQRSYGFAEHLISRGFVPISSDEIADGPDAEGQELFAIGFPGATAVLGEIGKVPADVQWSSNNYSLPVASFGRVSMLHSALDFFWADISIYPGNSGGPVVANDRLVGIVSAQATIPIDGIPHVRTRIPFGRIIKTSHVRDLLEAQVEKDRQN
jgi:hypothetical protein